MTAPQDIGRLRGQVRVLELATLALMVQPPGEEQSEGVVLALRTAREFLQRAGLALDHAGALLPGWRGERPEGVG